MSVPLPDSLRSLYPFQPRSFVTPGGARMSYLDEGPRSEEAVVMLHGNPTWSFFYRDVVKDLAPQLRCVVPDHVGMGLSDKPHDYAYTLESRIGDVEALIGHLGVKRIHLVVHDWGGAIGFGVATRQSGRVGKIVILNTAAFVSNRIPARIALCRAGSIGEWLVRGLNGFAGPAVVMAMSRRVLTREERAGYLHPYASWNDRIAVHRFVRDIPLETDHVSRATLEEIERRLPDLNAVPKLILWGGRDFCFNDHFLARWREIYPQATVQRMADVGHYVLDDAGPEAREPIKRFLTQ